MKNLVIIESAGKIKKLREILGKDYTVMACYGHVRELTDNTFDTGELGKIRMGIDVQNDFKPSFKVNSEKADVVKNLKAAVKEAENIYLATDPDREGYAIAWHLVDLLKLKKGTYKRIVYNEITPAAIQKAFANPVDFNVPMIDAALTRSKIDKIIGYVVSPITMRCSGGKSAGRVQSVALKIVCDREKEILEFVPREYYELYLPFIKGSNELTAQYKGTNPSKKETEIASLKDVQTIIDECEGSPFKVEGTVSKNRTSIPKPPYTTSSFQQDASSKLGLNPTNAMKIAQKLYELGYITYMRTDSTSLSETFIEEAKEFIDPKMYHGVHEQKSKKKSAAKEQHGHECLRVAHADQDVRYLKSKEKFDSDKYYDVYELIYCRTLASLMIAGTTASTEVTIVNGKHRFGLSGSTIVKEGWMSVYENKKWIRGEDVILPTFKENEKINDNPLQEKQKFTQPKGRYSEASLVKQLEESGIGRPSTFATMCKVITDEGRGYGSIKNGSICPTELGMKVYAFLDDAFNSLFNMTYSAEMEEILDKIANEDLDELDAMKDFWNKLVKTVKDVQASKWYMREAVEGMVCPNCGGPIVIKNGKYGEFKACDNYPTCKTIIKEPKEEDPNKVEPEKTGVICNKCNKHELVIRHRKSDGKPFYACSGFTATGKDKCSNIVPDDMFEKLKEARARIAKGEKDVVIPLPMVSDKDKKKATSKTGKAPTKKASTSTTKADTKSTSKTATKPTRKSSTDKK